MKDITQEVQNFVNGADQGTIQQEKVVNKYKNTSLAFNSKQREFFDLVKNKVIEKAGKISVSKFLLFLWQYHTQKNKCVLNHYLDYSLFISSSGSKGNLKPVTTNWNDSLDPLKIQVIYAERVFGKIGLKGVILIFVLHYAKNVLDIDLTPYRNQ